VCIKGGHALVAFGRGAGIGRAILTFAILTAAAAPAPVAAQTATRASVTAALHNIEAYIDEHMQQGMVPGLSVAVVFDDEVVYLKGFGVREAGKPEPVDADTVFQLASCSKPISSSVVAAIVDDGKSVSWDSPIADIDPSFRLFDAYPSQQVTIRDLFAHRSGLPGNAGNDLGALGYDRDTILHRLRLVPPSSSFRSGYFYSNFGLTEGAVAAARTTGKPWEDIAEELVYAPLGMTSTSSRYTDFLKHDNCAALHVLYQGQWQALSKRMPDAQAPAGGVSSNARDLAQWMRLELGNGKYDGEQLIPEAAIAETHLPVIRTGSNPLTGSSSFYALGWVVNYGPRGVELGHAGAFSSGARTVVKLVPSAHIGIVVLTNAFPTGAPDAVADTFLDFVFDGTSSRNWLEEWNDLYDTLAAEMAAPSEALGRSPPSVSPALPDDAYTGIYTSTYFGDAVVVVADGRLQVKLGPEGAKVFLLSHFDRDIFYYYPYDEMPDAPSAATFEIGPDGKATEAIFDDLNGEGLGVFTRTPE